MKIKTGIGYDVHRFIPGNKLVLGGVDIQHTSGLQGHSDADVLLHAVCDALLGALGVGDIGEHFPNTDAKYKDISSVTLLEKVRDQVYQAGYEIGNVDVMLILEEPKINAYKEQMKKNIAKALNMPSGEINIKATTQEQLGSIGRQEGAAALATVLIGKE